MVAAFVPMGLGLGILVVSPGKGDRYLAVPLAGQSLAQGITWFNGNDAPLIATGRLENTLVVQQSGGLAFSARALAKGWLMVPVRAETCGGEVQKERTT